MHASISLVRILSLTNRKVKFKIRLCFKNIYDNASGFRRSRMYFKLIIYLKMIDKDFIGDGIVECYCDRINVFKNCNYLFPVTNTKIWGNSMKNKRNNNLYK